MRCGRVCRKRIRQSAKLTNADARLNFQMKKPLPITLLPTGVGIIAAFVLWAGRVPKSEQPPNTTRR